MEPQRGEEEQLGAWATNSSASSNNHGSPTCLCPAAASPSARHALEQEVRHRADLQLLQGGATGGVDRRRERMMKNRASATRSRARRHAYMKELEEEARLLRAENDHLRKLCEELEATEVQMPVGVKRTTTPQLQRTSSAPF